MKNKACTNNTQTWVNKINPFFFIDIIFIILTFTLKGLTKEIQNNRIFITSMWENMIYYLKIAVAFDMLVFIYAEKPVTVTENIMNTTENEHDNY